MFSFQLISANEKLEEEIVNSKDRESSTEFKNHPEICRLQAENTILQKNLTGDFLYLFGSPPPHLFVL